MVYDLKVGCAEVPFVSSLFLGRSEGQRVNPLSAGQVVDPGVH